MDFKKLYELFSAEMTPFDCGRLCASHNPGGKPYCCDICHAVPAAYLVEWDDLQPRTDLWHEYRGDECIQKPADPAEMLAETPEHMLLLACKGPALCQRDVRAISCRQFPFYPYIDSQNRFIGLAYEWAFEPTCWVINHLDTVTAAYRQAFTAFYDHLFSIWEHDLDSYAAYSEEARAYFTGEKRGMPLLHRDGSDYLVNPESEELQPVLPHCFRRFEPYT